MSLRTFRYYGYRPYGNRLSSVALKVDFRRNVGGSSLLLPLCGLHMLRSGVFILRVFSPLPQAFVYLSYSWYHPFHCGLPQPRRPRNRSATYSVAVDSPSSFSEHLCTFIYHGSAAIACKMELLCVPLVPIAAECLSTYLPIYLSIYLCTHLSIYLYTHISIYRPSL